VEITPLPVVTITDVLVTNGVAAEAAPIAESTPRNGRSRTRSSATVAVTELAPVTTTVVEVPVAESAPAEAAAAETDDNGEPRRRRRRSSATD
jgi:hypothetical protein